MLQVTIIHYDFFPFTEEKVTKPPKPAVTKAPKPVATKPPPKPVVTKAPKPVVTKPPPKPKDCGAILLPADFKGGKAGASSFLGGHGPSQAFELSQWKGVYLPWANLNTAKFPHTVWYQFPSAITVGKFAFSSRSRMGLEQAPVEFQFLASNDCKKWKVLETYQTKFTRLNEEKSWKVPCDVRSAYRCYGLKVLKVTSGIYTAIKHMKMWKVASSEVLVPASLKGGNAGATSSLKTHPPIQAFNDAKIPWANLNTAKMPQTVWYQFPEAIQVARFAFSSRGGCCLDQAPLEFEFVASNDCKNWIVIQGFKTQFTKLKQEKSWMIPAESRGIFKCYGIKVKKVKSGVYTSIAHFKMWKSAEMPTSEKFIPASYQGGQAGASSSLGGHGPLQAFEVKLWKGAYAPWANLNTAKFPHMVWYKFAKPIQVAKFAFSSRTRQSWIQQSPTDFEFVGSNDCKNWRALARFTTQFTKLNEEKSWIVPSASRNTYSCYGIKVYKVKSGIYAAIKHMKMWKEAEKLIPAPYEGGQAGASSSLGGHGPLQAFEVKLWKGALPWANLKTAKFPHTVWYKFAAPIQVAKFAFSSRTRGYIQQSPTDFEFMGSSDCKNWNVIARYQTQFTKLNEEQAWTIPPAARSPYQCYGIKVYKVKSGVFTAIMHTKMWTKAPGDHNRIKIERTNTINY